MAMPKLCQVGVLINALYLIGWIIALIGLALSQAWCKDNENLLEQTEAVQGDLPNFTLLAHNRGDDCSDLYRFPWFIWALSTLPVLLSLGHIFKPSLVRRGSAALAAVLAVLQMIATDSFHNLAESELAQQIKKVERGNKVVVTGFAVLSAMSLLMILLESLLGDRHHEKHVAREARDDAGGKVVANEPAVKV